MSGTCEPACWGDGLSNGPAGNTPSGDAGTGKGNGGGSDHGCATAPGGSSDAVPWLLAVVGAAVVTGKRRRR
jgi:MYXO-CTERM domain-containing protein